MEGNARLDAWRGHFRDVPAPAAAPLMSSHDTDDPNLTERVRNLRGAMSRIAGQLHYAFSEPELLQVLPELPPGGFSALTMMSVVRHSCVCLSLFAPGQPFHLVPRALMKLRRA